MIPWNVKLPFKKFWPYQHKMSTWVLNMDRDEYRWLHNFANEISTCAQLQQFAKQQGLIVLFINFILLTREDLNAPPLLYLWNNFFSTVVLSWAILSGDYYERMTLSTYIKIDAPNEIGDCCWSESRGSLTGNLPSDMGENLQAEQWFRCIFLTLISQAVHSYQEGPTTGVAFSMDDVIIKEDIAIWKCKLAPPSPGNFAFLTAFTIV